MCSCPGNPRCEPGRSLKNCSHRRARRCCGCIRPIRPVHTMLRRPLAVESREKICGCSFSYLRCSSAVRGCITSARVDESRIPMASGVPGFHPLTAANRSAESVVVGSGRKYLLQSRCPACWLASVARWRQISAGANSRDRLFSNRPRPRRSATDRNCTLDLHAATRRPGRSGRQQPARSLRRGATQDAVSLIQLPSHRRSAT